MPATPTSRSPGNGGIDVVSYDLDLDYTPPAPEPAPLDGDARRRRDDRARRDRRPRPVQPRSARPHRESVTVNGKSMAFDQTDNELVITPRPKLKTGQSATVVVTYGGTTTRPTDIEGALYGWVTTRDGAMVVSEPDGAATWFPANDHPTDKSTYTFEITVPEGLDGGRERPARRAPRPPAADDVDVGRARPDGGVPRDRDRRRLHASTSTPPPTERRSSTRSTRPRIGCPTARSGADRVRC